MEGEPPGGLVGIKLELSKPMVLMRYSLMGKPKWFDMRVLPSHHALAQFAEDLYTTFSLGTHPFLEWDANRDRDEDYELSSDDGASSTDDEPSQDVEKPAKKKPKKSCKPDQVVSALPKPPAFFRRWMF